MWTLHQWDSFYGDLVILRYLTTMAYLWKKTAKVDPLNMLPNREISKKVPLRVMVRCQHSYPSVKATLAMMTECLGLYETQTETHSIRTICSTR